HLSLTSFSLMVARVAPHGMSVKPAGSARAADAPSRTATPTRPRRGIIAKAPARGPRAAPAGAGGGPGGARSGQPPRGWGLGGAGGGGVSGDHGTPDPRGRKGQPKGSDHDEPAADADGHRLGAAARLELGEDLGDVEPDRAPRDAEPRGDDLVPEALGHHGQH